MINPEVMALICFCCIAISYYSKVKYHYDAINYWEGKEKLSFRDNYKSQPWLNSFLASFPVPIITNATPDYLTRRIWGSFFVLVLSVVLLIIAIN